MIKARKISGYRLNGKRIYAVKGKTKSRRRTYKSKEAARKALKRR